MGSVLLLKAQINSTIKFTKGMVMIKRVTIQSPTDGIFCSFIYVVLVTLIYDNPPQKQDLKAIYPFETIISTKLYKNGISTLPLHPQS